MAIIITGAGGFVGQQLLASLLAKDMNVVGMDNHVDHLKSHKNLRSIAGDMSDAAVREDAMRDGCDALVHLATVPGGAAEADPAASRRINIDAMYDLLEEAAVAGNRPRVVYASSIAVYGDPLPSEGVDDQTPLSPKMVYGGHKAMMETAVAMLSNRGAIDGVTVRLPGILARPKGPSGMKSAFMSDLFHALKAGQKITCPVSPQATIWAESVACCANNIAHALTLNSALLPPIRAVTLPALRITMSDLAQEIARQCSASPDLVTYQPNADLESAFGAHPTLKTPAAERAGFTHDGSLANLVASALQTLN